MKLKQLLLDEGVRRDPVSGKKMFIFGLIAMDGYSR